MKTTRLAFGLTALLVVAGCSDGETLLPDILIDYGYVYDNGTLDTVHTDAQYQDTGVADHGRDTTVADNGQPVDAVQDTGPCTAICPAAWRCGPNPCGTGECAPGCGGDKPVCNLETRLCEPEVCVPECTGRVCGYDGCGGNCPPGSDGKCTGDQHCNYNDGQCGTICYPACTGKACGDDGCGSTCKPGCASADDCTADGYCDTEGRCQAAGELKCDADNYTDGGGTTGSGTTMSLYHYSSGCASAYNPGPEKAYKLVVGAGESGNLEVEISQSLPFMATFLDVYMIEDTGNGCQAADCVARGLDGFTYQVPASASGHTYYLVADAGIRNNGSFTITIKKCGWNGFDADAMETADQ